MNKAQLTKAVAQSAELSEKQAKAAIDAITDGIAQSLVNKEEVALIGFGTFKLSERSARTGRNPKTGEPIQIAATTLPTFKAGSTLKARVNP